MELPQANDRGKRLSHKNDSQQWDEIEANWNQATDSKKQCKRISWQWKNVCDTKPTQILREVGRKTLAYVFLSRFPLLFSKGNAQTHIHFPPWSWRVLKKKKKKKKKKKCLYLPYISPVRILYPVRSPCFILTAINSFIHITYYSTTRYEIKPASKLKESKSKCSSSCQV